MKCIEEDNNKITRKIKVGKLNFVDLAGSERASLTGATGARLEECKKINTSLSALGNVIASLTDLKSKRIHIPYRNYKIIRRQFGRKLQDNSDSHDIPIHRCFF